MGGGIRGTMAGRGRWRVGLVAALLLATLVGALGTPAPAAAATITVNSSADAGGTCPGPTCTLRAAISAAQSGDTIMFASSVTTITLASTLPTIDDALTITGPGMDQLTIAGNQTFPLLAVNAPGREVGLRDLTLTKGKAASNYGGNIRSTAGNLTLTDVALTEATGAPNFGGGGAYLSNGTFTLTRVTVSGNALAGDPAYGAGAGLFIDNFYGETTAHITGSVIINNRATAATGGLGGGLAVLDDNTTPATTLAVTLTNTTVSANGAANAGGGIYVKGGTLDLTTTTVNGNEAKFGGGLYVIGGIATLTGSTITDNHATYGSGIHLTRGTLALTSSTISRNTFVGDDSYGGGIHQIGGTAKMTNTTISGNSASHGGGISVASNIASMTLTATTVSHNSATGDAGGLYVANGGTATLIASIVAGNTISGFASDCSVAPVTGGGNVVGATCYADPPGNLDYKFTGPIGDLLLPLADNNGITQTHALPARSFAIERMAPTICADTSPSGVGGVDQRGQPRPTTGYCDSGAYERPAPRLTIVTVGNGTVDHSPAGVGSGPYSYSKGDSVTLIARPATGYSFKEWLVDGDSAGYDPTLVVQMYEDTTVTATFGVTRLLTVTIVGNGQVQRSRPGTDAGANTFGYADGVLLRLTPLPDLGYRFAGWKVNTVPVGEGNLDFSISANTAVEATFVLQTHDLTINTAGTGSGTVDRNPAGSGGGPFAYDHGTAVTLTAQPAGGSRFAGWLVNGVPQPGTGPLTITLNATTVVVADFVRQAALTVQVAGGGRVDRGSPGTGDGPFYYEPGTALQLVPVADAGQTFVGWAVDGVVRGWADPLTITLDGDHTVVATFKPTKTFPDVGTARADREAIVALASRGTIQGYANGNYGPDNRVTREEMAALIARATPKSVADGAGNLLAPPNCVAANSWDCEVWADFTFKDIARANPVLRRPLQALAHYGVAKGYTSGNYGPKDNVTYAQTIAFITRAMIAKGYWVAQPAAPPPDVPIPDGLLLEVRTFAFYTGVIPAEPTTTAAWAQPATRGWFARALWEALDSYWGVDGTLTDTRDAGGFVP